MARSPFLTPVHFTAARFQTLCRPSDSTSLSWSYTGAMSLNSSWRSSAAAELYCSSGRPVMNFFSGRREGDDAVVSAVVSAAVSTVVAALASLGGAAEVNEPFFASSAGFDTGEGIAGTRGRGVSSRDRGRIGRDVENASRGVVPAEAARRTPAPLAPARARETPTSTRGRATRTADTGPVATARHCISPAHASSGARRRFQGQLARLTDPTFSVPGRGGAAPRPNVERQHPPFGTPSDASVGRHRDLLRPRSSHGLGVFSSNTRGGATAAR